MRGLSFRSSACGRYIVSLIGESPPRVLTTEEAGLVRDLYAEAEDRFLRENKPNLAKHEGIVRSALDRALAEAAEVFKAVNRRHR